MAHEHGLGTSDHTRWSCVQCTNGNERTKYVLFPPSASFIKPIEAGCNLSSLESAEGSSTDRQWSLAR